MTTSASRRWRAVVLLVISVVATTMTLIDLQWSSRSLVSVAFHLLVPGCAVVSLRRLDDPLTEVTVGIAVSVAIGTGMALAMLAVDRWEPQAAQVALAVISTPLLAVQVRRRDDGDRGAER